MPKKGYIHFTNQIPKLETKDFLIYVFRKFCIGTELYSGILHCPVEAMRNGVVNG